jgi:hypothetical protein
MWRIRCDEERWRSNRECRKDVLECNRRRTSKERSGVKKKEGGEK